MNRPEKITFGEMRSSGVRGVLVYCSDYRCSHSITLSADRWSDDVRLSDLEPLFTCMWQARRRCQAGFQLGQKPDTGRHGLFGDALVRSLRRSDQTAGRQDAAHLARCNSISRKVGAESRARSPESAAKPSLRTRSSGRSRRSSTPPAGIPSRVARCSRGPRRTPPQATSRQGAAKSSLLRAAGSCRRPA